MAGHRSMAFSATAVTAFDDGASPRVYHPEDGLGGVEVVVTDELPTSELLTPQSECRLRRLDFDYQSAGAQDFELRHGDGSVAWVGLRTATSAQWPVEFGPDGLRLDGQWHIAFAVNATVVLSLLFDIDLK